MNTPIPNKELAFIRSIAGDFARHPRQVNGLLQGDAEIIRLSDGHGYLVMKVDGIMEEIREGLYEDPYLIGWMTVTAPLSDLAAVGAGPDGLLLSLVLPPEPDSWWLKRLKTGIQDACSTYGTWVLGGDTNTGTTCSTSATAIGYIKTGHPLLRTGMLPGDWLYTTAPPGLGNAFAYCRLLNSSVQIDYRPLARLQESRLISRYASACMDTSDGLFPALSVLAEINNVGFDLDLPLDGILHPAVQSVQQAGNLPAWWFVAGPHGDYELLFTIPEEKHAQFIEETRANPWQPLRVGRVIAEETLCFLSGSLPVCCSPALVPNLFAEAGGKVPAYFNLLQQQHETWSRP